MEGHLPPPLGFAWENRDFGEPICTLYIESFEMKFREVVYLVFVIPKPYHLLNLEFLYKSYA